jgi:hypothetical protein
MIINIFKILIFIFLLAFNFSYENFLENLLGSVLLSLFLLTTTIFYLTAIDFLYSLKSGFKIKIRQNFSAVTESFALFIWIEMITFIFTLFNIFDVVFLKQIYNFLFTYIFPLTLFFTYKRVSKKDTSESTTIVSTYLLTIFSMDLLFSLI